MSCHIVFMSLSVFMLHGVSKLISSILKLLSLSSMYNIMFYQTHDDEMMKMPTSMFNKLSQVFVKEKIWDHKSFYHNFAIIVIWLIVSGRKKKMIRLCKSNKQPPTIYHIKMMIKLRWKTLWSHNDTYVKTASWALRLRWGLCA